MQTYHNNSKTNISIRKEIKNSDLSNLELSIKYNISNNTVVKWRNRDLLEDKSSKPHKISYSINCLDKALICSIRKSTWMAIDELQEVVQDEINPNIKRSSIYRLLKREGINKKPLEQREKAKRFKEYEPGFIHMDVTYLPKFNGKKNYLFVAIDRATRVMFYRVYQQKSSENTEEFVSECKSFFPFKITHILTDNGLEFTNKLIKSKTGGYCKKLSKLDDFCEKEAIQHRLTKINTPKTNGMVERVNQTIKNATILKNQYKAPNEMIKDLNSFLIFYLTHRRHGSLKKELNVKTPLNAVYKWYEFNPKLFTINPQTFEKNILNLNINKSEIKLL